MKRAFSVFTPMVGTIIITITLLIVASILQSERFAVAGTLQSYQSIKMANIMRGVQGLIEQEIRVNVYEQVVEKTDTRNDECFSDEILNQYGLTSYSGVDGCNVVMKGKTINEVETEMKSELAVATIQNAVNSFKKIYATSSLSSGETLTLDPHNVDFSPVLKDVIDESDGRLTIKLDFKEIEGEKVATIKTSGGSSVDVYMEPVEKEFKSRDPLITYGQKIGNLFDGFTIMDKTWHGAGGTDAHHTQNEQGSLMDGKGYGDGTQWYHYAYVMQWRRPPVEGSGKYIVTGVTGKDWVEQTGFKFRNQNDKPITLHKELEGILQKIKGGVSFKKSPVPNSSPTDILQLKHKKQLNCYVHRKNPHGLCAVPQAHKKIENFDAGYLRFDDLRYNFYDEYYSDKDFLERFHDSYGSTNQKNRPSEQRTVAAGGQITGTLNNAYQNWLEGDNTKCIHSFITPSDHAGKKWGEYVAQTEPGPNNGKDLVIVNTTEQYDDKYIDLSDPSNPNNAELKETVKEIKDHVGSDSTLLGSMGFDVNLPEYNMTIISYQYYSVDEDLEGGDNWLCGELMAKYVPKKQVLANVPPLKDVKSLEDFVQATTGSAEHVWYYSLPMNFTCPTFVLTGVKDVITLYRNNDTHPNLVEHRVYRATLTRNKTKYLDGPSGDETPWEGSEVTFENSYFDGNAEELGNVLGEKNILIRKCVYSYQSGPVEEIKRKCEWTGWMNYPDPNQNPPHYNV